MRDIKFRAWDNINKRMVSWEEMFKGDLFRSIFGNEQYMSVPPKPFWILQQYTGLKDKNGIDIYEGDILGYERKFGDSRLSEIRWAKAYSGYQWCEFDLEKQEVLDYYGGVDPEYQIIIGNIFETKRELDRNKSIYDEKAIIGEFTKRLISLTKTTMKRNSAE